MNGVDRDTQYLWVLAIGTRQTSAFQVPLFYFYITVPTARQYSWGLASGLRPCYRSCMDTREAVVREILADITHDHIAADLPARGADPVAADYIGDILLAVRKRLWAFIPRERHDVQDP